MSQSLLKLVSFVLVGLLIGCSSGDSGEPSTVVVVAADDAANGDSTTNTNIGSATGSDTGTEASDAGDDTSSAGETTAATESGTTSGNTDTGDTSAGAGTATTGTAGTADGTDASTEGLDTAAGEDTNGTTDDTGTTTDGTATATVGTTAGSDTDAGNDSAGTDGTDAGETAGTTGTDDGTTTGTDGTGTITAGTTTAGTTDYPIGSLAYVLNNDSDLSLAFEALQNANLDLAIDDPRNEFTLFLPTNEAIEALTSPSDFDIQRHIASGAVSSATLAALDGRVLNMNDGQALIVEGGGAEPLTIAGAELISVDIFGNSSTTVAHVIDTVIGDSTEPEFPIGSLAAILNDRDEDDMSIVLDLLVADNDRELILIDSRLQWTLFLPNDIALEGAEEDFIIDNHIFDIAVYPSTDLAGLSGSEIVMSSGNSFLIEGGTANVPLTIGGVEIVEADVQRDDMEGAIVHIINGVLVPSQQAD